MTTDTQPVTTQTNKAVVRRLIDEVFVGGRTGAVDELLTDDFTAHTWGPMEPGRDGLKAAMARVAAGLSDPVALRDHVVDRHHRIAEALRDPRHRGLQAVPAGLHRAPRVRGEVVGQQLVYGVGPAADEDLVDEPSDDGLVGLPGGCLGGLGGHVDPPRMRPPTIRARRARTPFDRAAPPFGDATAVPVAPSAPMASPYLAVDPSTVLEDVVESRLVPAPRWIVIVWNDPVNLMTYVTYVFRKLFGYSEAHAQELMLKVHNDGRAVVSGGTQERCEYDVQRLHAHGLWATMQPE